MGGMGNGTAISRRERSHPERGERKTMKIYIAILLMPVMAYILYKATE